MITFLNTLFASIIDYAGLFPPAKLELRESMMEYMQCKISPYHWMLGRFILPANRLSEFAALLPTLIYSDTERNDNAKPWLLSIVMTSNIPDDLELELKRITSRLFSSRSGSGEAFARHDVDRSANHDVDIVALEFPQLPPTQVRRLLTQIPPGVDIFFELPLNETLEAYLTILQGTDAFAKIRTGGITANAFPDAHQLSRFIVACASARVPFKATAGLHHLLTGVYPMTYEPDSLSTQMHGFLNVAIATTLAYCNHVTSEDILNVLQTTSIDQLKFQSDGVVWDNYYLSLKDMYNTRKCFFYGFGSCSFQEPALEIQNSKLV